MDYNTIENKINEILKNQEIINKKLDAILIVLKQQGGVDALQIFLQSLSLKDITNNR